MRETGEMQLQSLGREETLEKETATPTSTLAWKIPWTEAPGGLQSIGLQRIGHGLMTEQQEEEWLWSSCSYSQCDMDYLHLL